MRVCDHENEAEELRGQVAALQYERRKDAVVLRMAPRLQSSAEKLRQHLLGRSRGRGGGGGLRGAVRGSAGTSAAEMLHSLERELSASAARGGVPPKAMTWLSRAKQAVDALELANREGSEREDELLQLLVENLAPDEGAPDGASGGGAEEGAGASGGATPRLYAAAGRSASSAPASRASTAPRC